MPGHIIAWFIGAFFGFLLSSMLGAGKVDDLYRRISSLEYENLNLRDRLKRYRAEEIKEDEG